MLTVSPMSYPNYKYLFMKLILLLSEFQSHTTSASKPAINPPISLIKQALIITHRKSRIVSFHMIN